MFKSLQFRPSGLRLNTENESNTHKYKIVGFSVIMMAVAGYYQNFFGNAVYRSGQLQAEAMGNLKPFNKFWTKYDIQEDDVRKTAGDYSQYIAGYQSGGKWATGRTDLKNPESATWEWANQLAIADQFDLKTRKQIEQNWFTTSFGDTNPTYHDPQGGDDTRDSTPFYTQTVRFDAW